MESNMNFVFYDLETSGVSPQYDQPLQFAAIVTDSNFVEIERVDLRCRLAPHILPSPGALVVTGISVATLEDPELPTLFEFAQTLADFIGKWTPAVWIGYNSIKFDEEFLRQTFYQNLHANIYATQIRGNTRFDMLPALYGVRVRNPDLLNWPTNEKGNTVFKLERLAPENGFNAHNAHDALGDVEATVFLAKRIAKGDPTLWRAMVSNAHKANVRGLLESFQPLQLIERYGGEPQIYTGCFCGYSLSYATSAGFIDLEQPDALAWLNADDGGIATAVTKSPKAIRTVATNKAPILLPLEHPPEEILEAASRIANAPEFRNRVGQALADRYTDEDDPTAPVETRLYSGSFYSRADQRLLQEFQHASWTRRTEMLTDLSDPRLKQLGQRLVAFYQPALLSEDQRERFKNYLEQKWNCEAVQKPGWMTVVETERQLRELEADERATIDALSDIRRFINKRVNVVPSC